MITEPSSLKEIRWRGDSRKVSHGFPKGARLKLGKELTRIQMGLQPRHGKWLSEVGKGVQEIRIAQSQEAYRVIYVAVFGDCVHVLHAFHKKSKTGIATPRVEIDLASRRYRELVREQRLRL
jgi:phage-related protein